MEKNFSKKRNEFLITGIKSELVSHFATFDMPLPSWSQQDSQVDWCLQNYVTATLVKREVSVEPDLDGVGHDDFDIEIEHSDEDETYADLTDSEMDDYRIDNKKEELATPIKKFEENSDKLFKCVVCKKSYDKNKSLQDHLREIHSAFNLVCEQCGQLLHGKRTFNRHLASHLKIKKRAIDKREAIENLKIRKVNLKPQGKNFEVSCPKCPAILISHNALATHLRNVHSKGYFKCEICDSVLKCRTYLYAHMRRVHCEDSVPCGLCGKVFKSRRYVRVHIRNSH